jgi:hypothetical protein
MLQCLSGSRAEPRSGLVWLAQTASTIWAELRSTLRRGCDRFYQGIQIGAGVAFGNCNE